MIDLEAMDHDFWLFTDLVPGHDSVVHRDAVGGRQRMASLGTTGRQRDFEGPLSVLIAPALWG